MIIKYITISRVTSAVVSLAHHDHPAISLTLPPGRTVSAHGHGAVKQSAFAAITVTVTSH